jgi:hypothetical protein
MGGCEQLVPIGREVICSKSVHHDQDDVLRRTSVELWLSRRTGAEEEGDEEKSPSVVSSGCH